MNLKVTVPENWKKEGFNKWAEKIHSHVRNEKLEICQCIKKLKTLK